MNEDIKSLRDRTRRKPHNNVEVAAARTALVKQLAREENAVVDARTAKLRALRLAKEAADSADAAANPKASKSP